MLGLLFRSLFTICLIVFPFKKLKFTNFVLAIIHAIALLIMALAHLFPDWSKFLIVAGMAISGLVRGNISLIYTVSFENMRGRENPSLINIWSLLLIVGDAFGLLLGLLFLYGLNWNWAASLTIYNGLFLASSIMFYLLLEEVEIPTENRSAADAIRDLKEYYTRRTSNWLLLRFFFSGYPTTLSS